jgi:hypothetical protein
MSYRPGIAASIPGRTLDMNYRTLVLMIATITTATLVLCEPLRPRRWRREYPELPGLSAAPSGIAAAIVTTRATVPTQGPAPEATLIERVSGKLTGGIGRRRVKPGLLQ